MSNSEQNGLSRQWPEPGDFSRSIRLEFSVYVSAILLFVMAVTGYVITNQYVDMATQNVVDKLLVQTRSYSSPAGKIILSTEEPDALMLNNICRKLAGDNPDVYWAGIAGSDSTWLAHTELKEVIAGNQLCFHNDSFDHPNLSAREELGSVGDTIFLIVPIEENGVTVGSLEVASSKKQIAAAREASIISVVSITALMLLIGLPVTAVAVRRKLKPVTQITDRLKEIDFEDIKLEIPVYSRNELGYLSETLRVMGDKLNLAQKDIVEKERIAREMEIAREIQESMLPRKYPRTRQVAFSGAYRSALDVGGDYYDFITIDDDRLGFLVADVSGKSLPGMLVMLLTRDIVLRFARKIHEPAELLTAVNRELLTSIKKGMFVTMFFGLVNLKTGLVKFASAGHNPLIHIKGESGEAIKVKTKGFPLGLMPDGQFAERIETGRIRMEPRDWLVQYTDGINEAQNSHGMEYGMERFIEALTDLRTESPENLASEALNRLSRFVGSAPQYDDITLLTMKWTELTADNRKIEQGDSVGAC